MTTSRSESVWAVFSVVEYEGRTLLGLFATQALATEYAQQIKSREWDVVVEEWGVLSALEVPNYKSGPWVWSVVWGPEAPGEKGAFAYRMGPSPYPPPPHRIVRPGDRSSDGKFRYAVSAVNHVVAQSKQEAIQIACKALGS